MLFLNLEFCIFNKTPNLKFSSLFKKPKPTNMSFSKKIYFTKFFQKKKFFLFMKEKSDFSEILTNYKIDFQEKGNNLITLCPFHLEKTPSFYANKEKGVFHCFGCGISGNTYTFLKKMKNWNPKQISLQKNSSPIPSKNFSSYEKIKNSRLVNFKSLSVIQKVWNHYKQFFRSEKKTKILFFLRGFGYMSDRILGIGFSSVESKKLFKFLEMSGIKPVEIIESGFFFKNTFLAGKNPNQKKKILKFLDLFRGRIIIPIRNEIGLVVAFGGRVLLRNKLPKYFNSSDWGIFKKKRIVFSEDFNRNPFFYRSELTILVEGYLDSFIFFQNGIRFSNANLGTGISSYQLFKSGVTNKNSHLLFFFDSDFPGKKGVQNSFLKFKNLFELNFFNINVASIPEKNFLKDPDEVLYYKGSFLLTVQILNKALPIPFWVENFVCKDLLSQDKPEIFLDRVLNFFSTPYSGILIFKFFFSYIDTRSVKWMSKTNNFFLGQTGSIQPYIKANKKKLPESNFSNFKKFHQIQTYPKNPTFFDFQILSQKKMILLSFYYYKIREDVSQVCIPNNFFFFSPSNYFSQIRFSNLIFDFGFDFNSRIFENFSEKLILGLEKKESINLIEKRLGLDNEISRILPDVSSTIDVFLAKIAIYFSKKEKKKNSQKIKNLISLKNFSRSPKIKKESFSRKELHCQEVFNFIRKRTKSSFRHSVLFSKEMKI